MSDFDIDQFPTSKTAKRMLSRVSPVYQKAYVAKWLYQVMGIELDDVKTRFEELRDQRFVDTVTWGIEYLEYKYSIIPDDTLTLDERRSRLKRHFRKRNPLSPWQFEKLIYDAFGINISVDEARESGVLHVSVVNTNEDLSNPVPMYKEMRRIKPSHLMINVEENIATNATAYIGGIPNTAVKYEVGPAQIMDAVGYETIYAGGVPTIGMKYEIYPKSTLGAAITAHRYVGVMPTLHIKYVVTEEE